MKTGMKKLLALCMALAMLFTLCACGGTKAEEVSDAPAIPKTTEAPKAAEAAEAPKATEAPKAAAPSVPEETVAGCYKIVRSMENGEEQDLSSLAEMGIVFYIVLNDDATGYMDMLGEKSELKWDGKELIFSEDGSAIPYSYKAGVLTLENDTGSMICERLSDEEQAEYLANGSATLDDLFGKIGEQIGEQIGFGEPEESDIPEGAPSAGPVTAKLRDFTVTILGAEAVEDEDGAPAIRFWYEFTNNSEDLASVFSELLVEAGQDGMKLGMAYLPDDVPENMYGLLKVAPGYTIRCAELYSYDPEGGTVAFRLRDWDEDGAAIYYADPANLPGPPQDSFEIVPDGSVPDFMRDIPDTDGSAYVTDDIEVVEDWEGNDMLRIYISFTNNTDEETSFFSEYSVYAMQDGYELRSAYPKDETEEDANYIVDIKPGETILCAFNYAIRSDSPICIVIENFWGNSGYFGDILVSN